MSDADGCTSAAEIILYIKDIREKYKLNIELTYVVHKCKNHGININELKEENNLEFDLLIVPDAGTNDVDECKILKESNPNLDILILDHHIIEKENPYAIVVNCQDGQYPNPDLSGVGVVYKFIKECDKIYGCNADKYLDLVAVGQIADNMDFHSLETRYLSIKGLSRIKNQFLQELIKKNEYSIGDHLNIIKSGWYISPSINAVCRVGTMDEKYDLLEAMLGIERYKTYQPRRKKKTDPKPEPIEQTLQEAMARECSSIKNRQDKKVKESMEAISKIIDEKYKDDKIIIVNGDGILEKDFTGLVANKLAEKYKRPVLIEKTKTDGTFGGSGRNYKLSPIYNFNGYLTSTTLFNSVSGHSNAFGIELPKNKEDNLREYINEDLKDMEIEDVYNVDYEIPVGRLRENQIEQVGRWVDLWGNGLDEPLFAITDIHINEEDIKLLGDKKNFISFECRGIKFIKRFANEEIYNKMILKNSRGLTRGKKSGKIKMEVVGKFIINKFNDNEYPEIEIVDFNSAPDVRSRF